MAATLLDIAKKLNISIATVSRALNDRPGVGSDLRQRVIETANELGFVPNMAARSLVTSRTQTIGFVIHPFDQPFSSDPFYFPILMAMEAELVNQDYHIMLTSVNNDSLTNLRMVEQSRVDGLILAGPNLNPQFVAATLNQGIPVVLIDNKPGYRKANVILTHVAGHGHTRIAHIGGPLEWVSNRHRYNGYRAAMRDNGLAENVRAIHKDSTTIATGEQAAAELLDSPEPPTAIFAANDSMALGAARAAAARGLSIPGDLALVGFDNISVAEHFSPPLTTVRIFKEQIGRMAAHRILELVNEPDIPPVESSVSTELVTRQSCGCN